MCTSMSSLYCATGSWAGQGGFGATRPVTGPAPAMLFGHNVTATASEGAFILQPAPGQALAASANVVSPGPPPAPAAATPPLQGFGSPAFVDPVVGAQPPFGMATASSAAVAVEGVPARADGAALMSATGSSVAEELQAFRATTFTLGKVGERPSFRS